MAPFLKFQVHTSHITITWLPITLNHSSPISLAFLKPAIAGEHPARETRFPVKKNGTRREEERERGGGGQGRWELMEQNHTHTAVSTLRGASFADHHFIGSSK